MALGKAAPDEATLMKCCFGGVKVSRIRMLTAARTSLGMMLASLPVILGSKRIEAHNGLLAPILVSIAIPAAHRIGGSMEQVKMMIASGIIGYLCSIPWQHLIWLNSATPWIGVAWLVLVGVVGSILVSWLDRKLSSLLILRLSLLFICLGVTFAPMPSSSSHGSVPSPPVNTTNLAMAEETLWATSPSLALQRASLTPPSSSPSTVYGGPLQLLLMHLLAAGTILLFGLLSPFVASQLNGDFASMSHNCAVLFDEMAEQLKLTKQDSLESDPSVLDITDEQNLLEFDQLRRMEEKKVRQLEGAMLKRMKVMKSVLDVDGQMELWADATLISNHATIYHDLDRLMRDFIQMRIALETGFIPRLSLILIHPILPLFSHLRLTIHQYILIIESSLNFMFNPRLIPIAGSALDPSLFPSPSHGGRGSKSNSDEDDPHAMSSDADYPHYKSIDFKSNELAEFNDSSTISSPNPPRRKRRYQNNEVSKPSQSSLDQSLSQSSNQPSGSNQSSNQSNQSNQSSSNFIQSPIQPISHSNQSVHSFSSFSSPSPPSSPIELSPNSSYDNLAAEAERVATAMGGDDASLSTRMRESETLKLSKHISTITQAISKTWIENVKRLVDMQAMKLSPTAELTRLNFFLWRVAELRKRLKSLEHSVRCQVRHASGLGWGWYLKAHLSALIAPFISLLQGFISVIYLGLAMGIRFFLWIVHPCCCKKVKWEELKLFGGRAVESSTPSVTNGGVTNGGVTNGSGKDGNVKISPNFSGGNFASVKFGNNVGNLKNSTSQVSSPQNQQTSFSSESDIELHISISEQYLSDLEMTSGDETPMDIVIELPEPSISKKGGFRIGTGGVKFTNTFFHDWMKGGGWKFPMKFSVALMVSAVIALAVQLYLLPEARAAWACVTVLIVFVPTLGGTLKRAVHRMLGTLLGALASFLTLLLGHYVHPYMTFFPYMLFTFFVTYQQHSSYKPKPYSWNVANFTFAMIYLLSWDFKNTPAYYATLAGYRCVQVLAGGLIVVLSSFLFTEKASDSLYALLLSQTQKSVHAFIEMIALTNSAIQETGKITTLVTETHNIIFPASELLKLAKAELRFFSTDERLILIHITRQLELISDILVQMSDTLKAGFSYRIRDWIQPFMDLMMRCVLFIEEDTLLVASYITTRGKKMFRVEPTRIPSILHEMDAFYLKLRSDHPNLHDTYPEAFRLNAFLHTTRQFIVAFSNLVYFVTEPEQHNQLIHLYSR